MRQSCTSLLGKYYMTTALLYLRHSTRSWWYSDQLELSQRLIVLGHLSLALHHLDLNLGLAVCRGGEDLALLGRDRGVAVDQLGEYAAWKMETFPSNIAN